MNAVAHNHGAGKRLTIADCLKSRENNFDFLRLAAAFLVLFSHSWPIRDGNAESEPYHRLTGAITAGEVALGIFFIISGLLVARSFLADPRLFSYLKKRALRIFPGLMACVLFCLLVVGPLYTTMKMSVYFHDSDTLHFIRNAVLYPNSYYLGGVFDPYWDARGDVNGSLWTLPIEFIMYLAIAAVGMIGLLRQKFPMLVVTVLSMAVWIAIEGSGIASHAPFDKYRVWIEDAPRLASLFLSGTVLLLFADRVSLRWQWMLAALVVFVLSWNTPFQAFAHVAGLNHLAAAKVDRIHDLYTYILTCLSLPYIVMYLAFLPIPHLQRAAKHGDFSYGIYLYAYPVQQMIMRSHWGEHLPFAVFIALSCVGTLVLAYLSWHCIERPFLKLKGRSTRSVRAVENPESAPQPVRPLSFKVSTT
jgi:peptidoglycan/LPS O-acetylase OafA/YrhL